MYSLQHFSPIGLNLERKRQGENSTFLSQGAPQPEGQEMDMVRTPTFCWHFVNCPGPQMQSLGQVGCPRLFTVPVSLSETVREEMYLFLLTS